MMEVDCAHLRHAAGEERVSYGCGEHDGDEDGVLGWLESVLHLLFKRISQAANMLRIVALR
jgi:hypothetical protein